MIGDLDEAKRVEDHAAEIETAPVVSGASVEVCATCIVIEDKYLKGMIVTSQEPAENVTVKVEVVPPVAKDDIPSPAANGDGHPGEESAEPVEERPAVVVPGVSTWRKGLSCYRYLLDTRSRLRTFLRQTISNLSQSREFRSLSLNMLREPPLSRNHLPRNLF